MNVFRGATFHRYVAREIVLPAVAALAFLFQLLIALQLLRRTDVLFGPAVRAKDVGLLLVNLTPHYLTLATPMALLIGILVGLGRLSEDREVEVLLGCGVSPAALAVAPAVLAIVVAVLVLGLELGPEPLGLQAVRQQIDSVLERGLQRQIKPGTFYDEVTGLTLFAESIDPVSGEWRHVLVNDDRDPRAPLLLLAERGRVEASETEAQLRLRLGLGEAHRRDQAAFDYARVTFHAAVLDIGVGDSLLRKNTFRSPDDEETLGQLWHEVGTVKRQGGWWQLPAVALHRRLGIPLAALTLAWLGVPLAIGGSAVRNARARGYLFAILAVAGYYVLQHLGIAWGTEGRLAPWLAGELPNLAAVGVGALAWAQLWWRRW